MELTKEQKIAHVKKLLNAIPADDIAEFAYTFAENEFRRGIMEGQRIAEELIRHREKMEKKKIIH